MTSSQNRRENAWKSRKQNQKPHGEVKSLAELLGRVVLRGGGLHECPNGRRLSAIRLHSLMCLHLF